MRRGAKLGVLLALFAAGGALAFAGALPQGYLTVADVVADPAGHEGRAVELKGSVVPGSLVRDEEPVRFLIEDGARTIEVRWDPAHPLPDHEAGGTIEGKSVVVRGTVTVDADGTPYVTAHEMQVGCASKYRPDEG